jgi:tetratricopeptide (TPR) repeat protein
MGLNAAYLPLLRLNCAFSYLQDDSEGFSKALEKLSEINPRDAVLYEWLGDVEVRRRRLEVAILQYDEALRLDPERWSALASKGINLLRLGREREGAAALEVAYENDPYNIWTVNTLRLLDSFRRFDRSETDHFSVRLHQDESLALRAYVEGLLERCLSALEERYDHKIEGRVVFEMYPDHDDFAVRTLGLPGLGALGATFGKVVAMDSPSARPPGEFHWASTLWHEVAHVVTLSLSKSRVPRWFTEGLSMMEERLAGRGWGEGLSVSFVRAFEAGKLLPLSELNSGFVRPRYPEQLSVSYYQAGWVCELLVREFGMSKICEMLTRYGEGQNTEEVFEAVLGRSVAEVDRLFQQELSRHLSPLVPRLAEPEAILKDPEQLKAAVRAQPENFFLNLALGRRLAETGAVSDGVQYLEKAVELFPSFVGQQSPYAVLAILYRKQERIEDEIRIRRSWWHQSPLFVDNALRLAELLEDSGELVEACSILEEAMYVDPLSEDAHRRLGSLYLALGEPKKAAGEFLALLGLNPTNRAEAHYHLADALYQSGSHIAAKREVLLALEKAPGWEQAQQLLLEIVRQ